MRLVVQGGLQVQIAPPAVQPQDDNQLTFPSLEQNDGGCLRFISEEI